MGRWRTQSQQLVSLQLWAGEPPGLSTCSQRLCLTCHAVCMTYYLSSMENRGRLRYRMVLGTHSRPLMCRLKLWIQVKSKAAHLRERSERNQDCWESSRDGLASLPASSWSQSPLLYYRLFHCLTAYNQSKVRARYSITESMRTERQSCRSRQSTPDTDSQQCSGKKQRAHHSALGPSCFYQ